MSTAAFEWYTLYFHGALTPLALLIVGLVLMGLWELRVISNRTFYLLAFVASLGYWIHIDHIVFTKGLEGYAEPLSASVPLLIRLTGYAVINAVAMLGGSQMAAQSVHAYKLDLPRGLPYLRQRWAQRRKSLEDE